LTNFFQKISKKKELI